MDDGQRTLQLFQTRGWPIIRDPAVPSRVHSDSSSKTGLRLLQQVPSSASTRVLETGKLEACWSIRVRVCQLPVTPSCQCFCPWFTPLTHPHDFTQTIHLLSRVKYALRWMMGSAPRKHKPPNAIWVVPVSRGAHAVDVDGEGVADVLTGSPC